MFTLFSSPPCGLIISILWTILSTGPKFFFLMLLPLGPRRATMRRFPSHLRSAHFFMIWRTCRENKSSFKVWCDVMIDMLSIWDPAFTDASNLLRWVDYSMNRKLMASYFADLSVVYRGLTTKKPTSLCLWTGWLDKTMFLLVENITVEKC